MPTSADFLIQPRGVIEPDLFKADDPGGGTLDRLTAYLAEGYVEAAAITDEAVLDKAATAYAYWRALDAYVQQLRVIPTEQKQAEASRKYSKEQIDAIEARALGYKDAFDGYLEDVVGSIVGKKFSNTVAVRKEICW